jgi:hypothetical protein
VSTYQGENAAHRSNVQAAESTRQSAVAAAGSSQATALSSEITFYRTVLASALANNLPASTYSAALRALGFWS